eukprot:2481781-Amphidinium_carterae.1
MIQRPSGAIPERLAAGQLHHETAAGCKKDWCVEVTVLCSFGFMSAQHRTLAGVAMGAVVATALGFLG